MAKRRLSKKQARRDGLSPALSLLDQLIETVYDKLSKEMKVQPKLGDFLKMIEMRQKLQPDESSQEEFWQKLDAIRQAKLSYDSAIPPQKTTDNSQAKEEK